MENFIIDEISLDHDLGNDEIGTGYDVLHNSKFPVEEQLKN